MTSTYQIRVKNLLDAKLSSWFGDFVISHTPNGDTLLTGPVIDQAALIAVITRCRDLGLTLISVNPHPIESISAESERKSGALK
jgi:hypothetical protein